MRELRVQEVKVIRIIKGEKHNKPSKPGGPGETAALSFWKVALALAIKVGGLKSRRSDSDDKTPLGQTGQKKKQQEPHGTSALPSASGCRGRGGGDAAGTGTKRGRINQSINKQAGGSGAVRRGDSRG